MRTGFLFVILLFSGTVFAQGSGFDCSYYSELESIYKCGPDGYPLKFGKRLCEKYLKAEPNLSLSIQWWFPRVRYCLQNVLQQELSSVNNCNELRKKALEIHVPCYEETGFCELSPKDKLAVLKVTNKDVWNKDILRMIKKVNAACR